MSRNTWYVVAGMAMGVVLTSAGCGEGSRGRGYRGVRSGPSTSTPTAATTATAPTTPTAAGTSATAPAKPAAPEGRVFRPGEADGATKEIAAQGLKVLKGAPGKAEEPTESNTYTVAKGGESVYDVARKWLGDEKLWRALYDENRTVIANPDKIKEGTVLDRPTDLEEKDDVGRVPGIGKGIR